MPARKMTRREIKRRIDEYKIFCKVFGVHSDVTPCEGINGVVPKELCECCCMRDECE